MHLRIVKHILIQFVQVYKVGCMWVCGGVQDSFCPEETNGKKWSLPKQGKKLLKLHGLRPHPAVLRFSCNWLSLLYSVLRLIPNSAAAAGLLLLCLSTTRKTCSISMS
jgi:hypothetical protein